MTTTIILYLLAVFIFLYLTYESYLEGGLKEASKFILIFGTLFFSIRSFVVMPFLVDGPSMSPTFETGHYLLVERLSFSLSEPKRGEVVVFDIPDKGLKASGHEKTCYIKNEGGSRFNKFLDNFASDKDCFWKSSRYLIKRLVGLPGDKVVVLNGVTTIYNSQNPNGFILNEKYVENENINVSSSVNLGPDEYFVMGDNRQNSSDGRYWGYVPRENLLGRPLVRLFPPSLFGFYPGDTDYK